MSRRQSGKGTVRCAGGPIHSCRFEFARRSQDYQSHVLQRRSVIAI